MFKDLCVSRLSFLFLFFFYSLSRLLFLINTYMWERRLENNKKEKKNTSWLTAAVFYMCSRSDLDGPAQRNIWPSKTTKWPIFHLMHWASYTKIQRPSLSMRTKIGKRELFFFSLWVCAGHVVTVQRTTLRVRTILIRKRKKNSSRLPSYHS